MLWGRRGRGNRGEFKFGAKFPDVSSEDIIEKVWESCFLTPEYKSGDEPERRIILADKGASEGKDSQ